MIYSLREGASPLILSMPHPGTEVPDDIRAGLNDVGRALADTDWSMRALYGFADRFEPTTIEARLSRYVIDRNRDPSGASLYPGQATTELVPTTDFDGRPIWRASPDAAEIERRKRLYFQPYHDALQAQIDRVKAAHGYCALYDCHSIRSVIPRLFPGELPVLNLGTNGGASCHPAIERSAAEALAAGPLSHVVNGRFKGGWITRRYGRPAARVHAVQMEIAMRAYLAEERPPWRFDASVAAPLTATLERVIAAILAAARDIERTTA